MGKEKYWATLCEKEGGREEGRKRGREEGGRRERKMEGGMEGNRPVVAYVEAHNV